MEPRVRGLMDSVPERLTTEFETQNPDEPITLAEGDFEVVRSGCILARINGRLMVSWVPNLRIVCEGTCDDWDKTLQDSMVEVHGPQLGLVAKAMVTNVRGWPSRRYQRCSCAPKTTPFYQLTASVSIL